jgi:anti-sigma regulatory factor (Ser/Thr protein kinase)
MKNNDVFVFQIEPYNFEKAGQISSFVKKSLLNKNVDKLIIKRVSIATYEAEINVVIHSSGGYGTVSFCDSFLEIEFIDEGPGIDDIEEAMTRGFSTASHHAMENGFGAGMGLPNIKSASDEFSLVSSPEGTRLKIGFGLEL